jgi:hypothetical protein
MKAPALRSIAAAVIASCKARGAPSAKTRVLYVDTLRTPHALTNIRGIFNAYRRKTRVLPFDYRTLAKQLSPEIMNYLLVDTAEHYRPDLVHLGKGESIQDWAVREIKMRTRAAVIHYYGDYRPAPQPWVISIGKAADKTLLYHKDLALIRRHQDAGIQDIGFWWPGADPEVFHPHAGIPRSHDVVFMANNADFLPGHHDRRMCVEAIADAGFPIHLYGNQWDYLKNRSNVYLHDFVNCESFAKACSKARITLGFDPVNDVAMYASWRRPLNAMAAGAFHLTRYFPGLENVFQNRKHLAWFQTVPEALELIAYYLEHEQEREAIAAKGRKEVLARHTWDHRIDDMLSFMHEIQRKQNEIHH